MDRLLPTDRVGGLVCLSRCRRGTCRAVGSSARAAHLAVSRIERLTGVGLDAEDR